MGRPKLQRTLDGLHKCSVCKELKLLVDFYKDSARPDGYGSRCKLCNKSYKKKYHKNYFSLEETKKKRREYWKRNPGKMKEMNKRNRERNGHRRDAIRREKHVKNPVPNMLQIAKRRALRKGLEFNLEVSDIIIPKYCPALDIEILVGAERAYYHSPSLDRIDNSKGYVKGNVVVVSHRADTIKAMPQSRNCGNF